jgi:cobyrinic acid a,c-diamide synthase
MITRHTVAEKIYHYLNHHLTLAQLVDWCENVLNDGEIADEDIEVVSEVAARVGVADVSNFGLLWKECEELLKKLGYELNFDLKKVA